MDKVDITYMYNSSQIRVEIEMTIDYNTPTDIIKHIPPTFCHVLRYFRVNKYDNTYELWMYTYKCMMCLE